MYLARGWKSYSGLGPCHYTVPFSGLSGGFTALSVQALSWVFDYSESSLGARLVLLSIANHASHGGDSAWPSIPTIARESHLSEREVFYSIPKLVEIGELSVIKGGGRGNSNLYSLPKYMQTLQGLRKINPAIHAVNPANCSLNPEQIAPEPSLTVILEPSICSACGAEGLHKCPGAMTQRQKEKRMGKRAPVWPRGNLNKPREEKALYESKAERLAREAREQVARVVASLQADSGGRRS